MPIGLLSLYHIHLFIFFFVRFFRGCSKPSVPLDYSLLMGRDPQENAKDVRDSSKRKGKLDFYFIVTNEVKNAYSLDADQNILDDFL